jgi:hypothetical protein
LSFVFIQIEWRLLRQNLLAAALVRPCPRPGLLVQTGARSAATDTRPPGKGIGSALPPPAFPCCLSAAPCAAETRFSSALSSCQLQPLPSHIFVHSLASYVLLVCAECCSPPGKTLAIIRSLPWAKRKLISERSHTLPLLRLHILNWTASSLQSKLPTAAVAAPHACLSQKSPFCISLPDEKKLQEEGAFHPRQRVVSENNFAGQSVCALPPTPYPVCVHSLLFTSRAWHSLENTTAISEQIRSLTLST